MGEEAVGLLILTVRPNCHDVEESINPTSIQTRLRLELDQRGQSILNSAQTLIRLRLRGRSQSV